MQALFTPCSCPVQTLLTPCQRPLRTDRHGCGFRLRLWRRAPDQVHLREHVVAQTQGSRSHALHSHTPIHIRQSAHIHSHTPIHHAHSHSPTPMKFTYESICSLGLNVVTYCHSLTLIHTHLSPHTRPLTRIHTRAHTPVCTLKNYRPQDHTPPPHAHTLHTRTPLHSHSHPHLSIHTQTRADGDPAQAVLEMRFDIEKVIFITTTRTSRDGSGCYY